MSDEDRILFLLLWLTTVAISLIVAYLVIRLAVRHALRDHDREKERPTAKVQDDAQERLRRIVVQPAPPAYGRQDDGQRVQ